MGSRGSPHGELYFDDCEVPLENLLMGEGSFPLLMQAFNMERLYIAALCLGLAQGAFDEAVAYSNGREQFGQPINEFQAVYHLIAEMWTQIESVRYLTYKAALTAERGRFPLPLDVSTAKDPARRRHGPRCLLEGDADSWWQRIGDGLSAGAVLP